MSERKTPIRDRGCAIDRDHMRLLGAPRKRGRLGVRREAGCGGSGGFGRSPRLRRPRDRPGTVGSRAGRWCSRLPSPRLVDSLTPHVGDPVRSGMTYGWLMRQGVAGSGARRRALAPPGEGWCGPRGGSSRSLRLARRDLVCAPFDRAQGRRCRAPGPRNGVPSRRGGRDSRDRPVGRHRIRGARAGLGCGAAPPGQLATIAEAGRSPCPATLQRLLPAASASDQTTLAWLTPRPGEPLPELGRFGTATIVVGPQRGAPSPSRSALVEDDLTGTTRIAVIGASHRSRSRSVTLGVGAEGWREIEAPKLDPGTKVILEGRHRLPDGTLVRIDAVNRLFEGTGPAPSPALRVVGPSRAWGRRGMAPAHGNSARGDLPRIAVIAESGERPGEEMLQVVTRPLEDAFRQVPGVREVRSITSRGSTEINLDCIWGSNMDLALQRVQARIEAVRERLPQGTSSRGPPDEPRAISGARPFAHLQTRSLAELRDVAVMMIRPALARLPGAAEIVVQGGRRLEARVTLDPTALESRGLDAATVADVLKRAGEIRSVGLLDANRQLYLGLVDARPPISPRSEPSPFRSPADRPFPWEISGA